MEICKRRVKKPVITLKSKTILLVALIFLGCSKENIECECDVNIIVVDGTDGITGSYTLTNAPSDCNGNVDWNEIRKDLPANHWYNGVVNCN